MVIVSDGHAAPPPAALSETSHVIGRLGLDAEVETRYDGSVRDGLLHAVASHNGSFVVVPAATESWLPTLLGASQHALVAECPVPVALVRPGTETPHRAVLALSPAQARRPRSATRLAVEFVVRMHKSGLDVIVVADGDPADQLLDPLGEVHIVDRTATAWIESEARPGDLLVAAGRAQRRPRNGARRETREP